jgi:hypothetical protein
MGGESRIPNCQYLLAVVEQGVGDLDCEAGGSVQAVPSAVGRRTGKRVECDVRASRWNRRPRLRSRPAGACLCNPTESLGYLGALFQSLQLLMA